MQQIGLVGLIAGVGAVTGWLVSGPAIWLWTGICVGTALVVFVAAIWGFEGFTIALLAASMLPLPTVALGAAQFPLASVSVLLVLAGAVWISRTRGIVVRTPHVWPYLALFGVAVVSLAASWLFWDARVPTGSERGYGHRSLEYQVTGLYLLAVPLLAYAGGVFASRLLRIERLYGWVVVTLAGLTLFALSTWIQNPSNPIDAFSAGDRVKLDYQWAAMLFVLALALVFHAQHRLLRLAAVGLLLLAFITLSVEYVLSSLLAALAVTMLMVWLRFRMRGLVLLVGALVLVGLIFEPTVATIVSQRTQSTDADRLRLWQSALIVWSKSPVIGVGPANLASYMETYNLFPLALVLQGYQQAHNIFLEILAEEGLVGLVLLGMFVGLVVRSLVRRNAGSRTQSFARTTALGLLVSSAVIAALGGGFVPTIASAGYNALPYVLTEWFLIGCGVGAVKSLQPGAHLSPSGRRLRGVASP